MNRIEFVTFHQSFSYEDFVEGLRPALNDDAEEGDLKYECRPGVFKRICTAAEAALTSGSVAPGEFAIGNRRLFKMSLGDTYRPEQASIYPECIQNGYVLLGYGKALDFTGCKTSSDITEKLKEVDPDIKPNDYNVTRSTIS